MNISAQPDPAATPRPAPMADRPRLKSPLDDPPPPSDSTTQPTHERAERLPELPCAHPKEWGAPSWVSVWAAPRSTVRAELAHEKPLAVKVLALLSGASGVMLVAGITQEGRTLATWVLLAATVGSLLGLVCLYLMGALVHRSGAWLGGVAGASESRTAVAWGAVPLVWLLPVTIVYLLALGSLGAGAAAAGAAFQALALAVAAATLLTLSACVGEAHRFSSLKGLAAILLAPLALVVLPFPVDASTRPQFSVRLLLLLMLVVAVACAAYPGVTRGGGDQEFYLIFLLVAPLVVLLVMGLAHEALRRRRR